MYQALVFFLISFAAFAAEMPPLTSEEAKHLGIIEMTLKNGMRVVLKPTDFDSDEVVIRMTAPGGFASLAKDEATAASLAAGMAWESGLDNVSADQMAARLYEYSIDLETKIQPYSRIIEGSCGEEGIQTFLEVVNLIFTKAQVTQEGYDAIISQARESIQKRRLEFELKFDDAVKSVNTQEAYQARALSPSDLERVDFVKAKKIFEKAFSHPAEFVLVIAGKFDQDAVAKTIREKIETIENKSHDKWGMISITPQFPVGVSSHTVAIHTRADCLTRITFPWLADLDAAKLHFVELTCQVIEGRLRRHLRETMDTSFGVDVGYELPFYPLTISPWVTIQFRSEPEKIKPVTDAILTQIRQLQVAGPTDEEIQDAKALQKRSDEFWMTDNCFWAVALSNYYLWGWNPIEIIRNLDEKIPYTIEDCKKIITNEIKTDNYTVISAKP